MKLRLLYFARLRERFGTAEENVDFAGATVAELLAQLRARGGVWAEELGEGRLFRVAVDQTLAMPETGLAEGAEVAIFPPVTGG
jgi:molybdopterin converting factor subunit 1